MSASRFEEIIDEMKDLLQEAINIIPDHAKPRAKAYWIAQMEMILDNDHGYMGGCGCSMVDTLEEWNDEDESMDEES